MKKVFISMPMKGRTAETIIKERNFISKKLESKLGKRFIDWIFIDSISEYTHPRTTKNKEIKNLAYSISRLADADFVYFVKGWENSRGCKIEHEIAKQYGIEIMAE